MSYFIKPEDIDRLVDEFVQGIATYLESIKKLSKVKLGNEEDMKQMKQEYTSIFQKLYLYAIDADKKTYSDEEAMIVCEQISDVAWNRSVSPYPKKVFWNTWLETALGKLVRMAIARKRYRNREPLNALDLALISMTTPANISNLINRGVIEAVKDNRDRGWIIPYEEAEKYLSTIKR